MRRTSAVLLLILAACQRSGPEAPAPRADAASGSGSGAGLERAAIKSGAILDASTISPVGLYRRRHEGGSDSLCIMPGKSGDFYFGAEASFGAQEHCRGQGTARRAGDKLVLSFSGGGRCIAVAQYDGDQVALPGVVDMKCDALCDGRGSLAGVSFPRVAGEAHAARGASDRDGEPLCDPD